MNLQVTRSGFPFAIALSDRVVEKFQWRLLGLTIDIDASAEAKQYSLTGCGQAVGADLTSAMTDAGFSGAFIFVAQHERKKVNGITRPIFDPNTAPIDICPTVALGSTPDFDLLDHEVGKFASMAGLKRNI